MHDSDAPEASPNSETYVQQVLSACGLSMKSHAKLCTLAGLTDTEQHLAVACGKGHSIMTHPSAISADSAHCSTEFSFRTTLRDWTTFTDISFGSMLRQWSTFSAERAPCNTDISFRTILRDWPASKVTACLILSSDQCRSIAAHEVLNYDYTLPVDQCDLQRNR
ncbi:Mitochondrial import receptor subunit TOM70 [Phytophthora pseudosyringae]|uniref:Mitochondrial import receptor subunit TOM70 n=1 Tax=Phytophthora pseudosyringae TaxID=221518 RepID=A0A8T1WD07_9STRA|nr:Mitochondrial import receptor subunit TOM70 [Phytophthora pseudosyringae]